ncbi:MAG: hypothetical protein ABIP94_14510 [Planctomycetota bacterium]
MLLAGELADPLPIGTWWMDESRVRLISYGGMAVHFAAPRREVRLRVRILDELLYRFEFRRGDQTLGEVEIRSVMQSAFGLQEYTADIPAAAADGFDTIWVDVPELGSRHVAGIGGLVFE